MTRALTPIQIQASQGFTSDDQAIRALTAPTARIGYTLGPRGLRLSQDFPYADRWAAWPSASGVMLKKLPSGLIWTPDESGQLSALFSAAINTNHLTLAFDQIGFEVIAYQLSDATIQLRQNSGTFEWTGFAPTLIYNGQFNSDTTAGASDVVCYYLRPGRNQLFLRLQRDNYGVEYVAAQLPCHPIDIRQTWFSVEEGNAYAFSGAGGSHATIPAVTLSGDFTVCFWAYAPGETTANFFGGGDETSGPSHRGYLRLAGGFLSLAIDSEAIRIASGTHAYSFGGQWQHLAITRTGNDYRIYSGGALLGAVVTATAGDFTLRMIGNSYAPAAATYAFGGRMYDFRIYSTAKTLSQIVAIAQGATDATALLRRYRMAENPQTGLEEGGQTATLAGITLGTQPLRGQSDAATRVHRIEVLDSGMRSNILATDAYPYPLVVTPVPPPQIPLSAPAIDRAALSATVTGSYVSTLIALPAFTEFAGLATTVTGAYVPVIVSPAAIETRDNAALSATVTGAYVLVVIPATVADNAALSATVTGEHALVAISAGAFTETAGLSATVTGVYAP